MTTFIDKVYKKCLHLNYKVYEINILDKGDHMSKIVEVINDILEFIWGERPEPKRARTKMGRFVADDKSTKDVNEAWEGGKAPKKGKK